MLVLFNGWLAVIEIQFEAGKICKNSGREGGWDSQLAGAYRNKSIEEVEKWEFNGWSPFSSYYIFDSSIILNAFLTRGGCVGFSQHEMYKWLTPLKAIHLKAVSRSSRGDITWSFRVMDGSVWHSHLGTIFICLCLSHSHRLLTWAKSFQIYHAPKKRSKEEEVQSMCVRRCSPEK